MFAVCIGRPDACCAITTMSKFFSLPSKCHHKLLKGMVRHLRMTRNWGIKHSRPADKQLDGLSEPNHQAPAPLPEALGEFNVDTSLPKLIGFVDTSFGSELRKRRSITGCIFFTFSGGAAEHADLKRRLSQPVVPPKPNSKLPSIQDVFSKTWDTHRMDQQKFTLTMRLP